MVTETLGATPPVAHLLVPAPPWRTGWPGVTGCARLADSVAVLLAPDEFMALYKARDPHVCGSCCTPAWRWRRWPGWQADPVAVVREDCGRSNRTGRTARLAAELRALSALAAAHPEEFARLLEGELVMDWMAGPARPRRWR